MATHELKTMSARISFSRLSSFAKMSPLKPDTSWRPESMSRPAAMRSSTDTSSTTNNTSSSSTTFKSHRFSLALTVPKLLFVLWIVFSTVAVVRAGKMFTNFPLYNFYCHHFVMRAYLEMFQYRPISKEFFIGWNILLLDKSF